MAFEIPKITYTGKIKEITLGKGPKAVAVGGLLALTAVNVVGVKAGAIFSDVFTVLKLAGIALWPIGKVIVPA